MNSKIITLGIVGVGLYVLYEWLSNQCSTAGSSLYGSSPCGWLGFQVAVQPAASVPAPNTPAQPAGTVVTQSTLNAPVTPPITSNPLEVQILALAAVPPTQLYNWDQWLYYYNQVLQQRGEQGLPLESILGQNIPMATRQTNIPLSTFIAKLTSLGMSGYDRGGIRTVQDFFLPVHAIHGGY